MTLFVLALVALAAILHVLWNTLVKKCENKASFAWVTSAIGSMILLPIFILSRFTKPGPLGAEVWGWAALSGLFEALYFISLFSAYGKADLSVVYPLSRGIAPLVTLLLGGLLVGDTVPLPNGLAVVLIVAGVAAIALSSNRQNKFEGRIWISGVCLSGVTGCMIAGYHLVDRQAMRLPIPPKLGEYLFLMQLFLALFISIWICLSRDRRRQMFSEWITNRTGVLVVGICAPLAYAFILLALCLGNVTYVAAGRNIGIVISTFAGAQFLKENISSSRIVGATLIAFGVVCLVMLGPHS